MPKLQQTKHGQFFLALPKEQMLVKGWQKGDIILVSIDKEAVMLKKAN